MGGDGSDEDLEDGEVPNESGRGSRGGRGERGGRGGRGERGGRGQRGGRGMQEKRFRGGATMPVYSTN